MSEDGSPAPVTPRKKRSVRISTGARKPALAPSNPYLDLEAVESVIRCEEENLDKYETDFIDDGDELDNGDGSPIPWPRTPSPTSTKSSGKGLRPLRTSVADSTPITPMTTRSRSKNPTAAASNSPPSTISSTRSRRRSKVDVLPGTERGDTQAKLETMRKPSADITVSMDTEEHEQFMLFKKSLKSSYKPPVERGNKANTEGLQHCDRWIESERSGYWTKYDSQSARPFVEDELNFVSVIQPAPLFILFYAVIRYTPVSSEDATMADGDFAASDATSIQKAQAAPSAPNDFKDASKKPVQAGSKRKRVAGKEQDDEDVSDFDNAGVGAPAPRATKDSGRSVAKTVARSVSNRTEAVGGSQLPKVPVAEFARLKETSPEKKQKTDEVVLHTVDTKSVKNLPDVCEVTDVDLQDPMMKPIYALDLPKLKRGQVTTWSSNEGPGMFMLSEYPIINPELSIETVWSLLLFVQKGHHINPARIDPRLLEARSPVYGREGPRKRWVLSVGERPAVCVSVVNTTRSSLQEISTVYGGANGAAPLLKYLLGVHLSQDFDRITGLCGMVFNLELMHVQLNMSALTFGTKGIPLDKYENLGSPDRKGIKSSSSLYRKQTYTAPSDTLNYDDNVPVYDARHTGFDASVDIDNLERILPLYKGEIPANSCTAVAYTISNFVKSSGRSEEQHLSFNIRWVVVLGEPK
ncbi:hypothetical protein DFH08DRAFT_973869 [Mycena albidolilacea]|uniref:Uncharacterized protein n=1 Tax=Mycena albidolilacea TaxID=1033008 RepID=A0AAD7ED54_9AGAR|nr:hypothetical protein DFH08DRAFT_973869 [Mycena albidolilacea]